jgi:small subunit ribosomal protein S2
MAPYIYGKRNKIHIIDVRETLKGLLRAKKLISQVVAGGDDVVFVGTKRQARHSVSEHAGRCGMPYVTERWLGGTLTNFRTVRSRLSRLEELEAMEAGGQFDTVSKKEAASLLREKRKILRNLGGIRNMDKVPGAMIVVDVRREHIAVREAQKTGVATIALIDTDSDPDFADLPIPGNDDAIRAIDAILTHLADAVEEGKKARTAPEPVDAEPTRRRRSTRPAAGRAEDEAASGADATNHRGDPGIGRSPGVTPGAFEAESTDLTAAATSEPDRPA